MESRLYNSVECINVARTPDKSLLGFLRDLPSRSGFLEMIQVHVVGRR